ncbi:hypothetical protein [Candidatus Nanohalococcus occultus]|uniref:hypothetical protein n=1 Tax=Candidatus Nanohalococcus occultus TaxID=2978047 RepID=UPI0039DFCE23
MTREGFGGIPESERGEDVKLLGIEYGDDRSARRRAEYRLQDKYNLELFGSPQMTVLVKGEIEELDHALQDIEETLGSDGELYVFEEESNTPETGFSVLEDGEFRYTEVFPDADLGEVTVATNGYLLNNQHLESEGEMKVRDGENIMDIEIVGERNPEAILNFEGSKEFAGRYSKSYSNWMKNTLE